MPDYIYTQQFTETLIIITVTVVIMLLVNSLIKKHTGAKSAGSSKYLVIMKIWRGVSLVLIAIALLEILAINGIHMGRYVAGLGIVSAIAGFALQEPIQDIIMGMTILAEGRFKIGDAVEYKGNVGKVVAFNLRTTWIFMFAEEKTVVISNREITEIALISDWIDIDIPIGYDQDLYASRALCREAAKRIERLRYVYSCDFLNTQQLAESWVEYKLRVHCLPEKRYAVKGNALAVIQDVFYEHNMPFPLSIKVIQYGETAGTADADTYPGDKQKVIVENQRKKVDYELGKGAAASKICVIDGSPEAVAGAISEAERYAVAENLGNKMKMRIRLLSEEAISLIHSLTDMERGEFYIERDGVDYEICLDADANVSSLAHEKLVSVSTSGSNAAYSGITGIINRAVDAMILAGRQETGEWKDSGRDMALSRSISRNGDDYRWSFNKYKDSRNALTGNEGRDAAEPESAENLEISVLSKFSDDIKIAVRANHVNIRILVKDIEEE